MTAAIEALAGPVALVRARPGLAAFLLVVVVLLTALTQIGGPVLWLCVPLLRRLGRRLAARTRFVRGLAAAGALAGAYTFASLAAVPLAGALGRVPLPCHASGEAPLAALSPLTCVLNRRYTTPHVRAELVRLADEFTADFPGARISYLDAGFPFFDGFPLPPHLSHGDGRRVDLALLFVARDTGRPLPGRAPSPIGYWGYVPPRPDEPAPCASAESWLRWDFAWLQPLLPPMEFDVARTGALVERLTRSPLVARIYLEPHLRQRLAVTDSKVGFQGCAAARHDDHIHVLFR